MKTVRRTKLIHEGHYLAEVDVELEIADSDWSPFLSPQDAHKLDDVRRALRQGDVTQASRHARVFSLTPIAV